MELPDKKQLDFYERHKVAPPSHDEHGVTDTWENPLSAQLKSGNARNWRMQGNILHADTDFGPIAQRIPTDYICLGEDANHLPIFKRIV